MNLHNLFSAKGERGVCAELRQLGLVCDDGGTFDIWASPINYGTGTRLELWDNKNSHEDGKSAPLIT